MKALVAAIGLAFGCAPVAPLVVESMDEIVPCDDPAHRIPVWCRSGSAWQRCGNVQCPITCSEGHPVKCSCCASQG